jgi:hypothetical protein
LDCYANAAPDPSGFGEGQIFLGQAAITTDGSGNVLFNVSFALPANVASVTATATQSFTRNTSEFGAAVIVAATELTAPPTGPTTVALALYPDQLLNLSTRLRVETGQGILIGGFIVSGTQPKKIIVRATSPSLAEFNVPGVLGDPVLELYDSSGQLLAQNDKLATEPGGRDPKQRARPGRRSRVGDHSHRAAGELLGNRSREERFSGCRPRRGLGPSLA